MRKLLSLIFLLPIVLCGQCPLEFLAKDIDKVETFIDENGTDAWFALYRSGETDVVRQNTSYLKVVDDYIRSSGKSTDALEQEIKNAGGFEKWRSITLADNLITSFSKLENRVSSLENSSFAVLTEKVTDQTHIWFGESGIPIIQTPKGFLNETGDNMFDLILDNKIYAKYDFNDGRILMGDIDGNYFAFVQELSKPIINNGENADKVIKEHIVQKVSKLMNLAGLNGIKTLNILGNTITTNPNKTNTFLGRFEPDMLNLFNELGNYKNIDLGEVDGGINVLNRPKAYEIIGNWWRSHNQPWLKRAIDRGDDIYLTTLPARKSEILDEGGNLLGMYAHELQYLVQRNYKPKNITIEDWEKIKTWFN